MHRLRKLLISKFLTSGFVRVVSFKTVVDVVANVVDVDAEMFRFVAEKLRTCDAANDRVLARKFQLTFTFT